MKKKIPFWVELLITPLTYTITLAKIIVFIPKIIVAWINTAEDNIYNDRD